MTDLQKFINVNRPITMSILDKYLEYIDMPLMMCDDNEICSESFYKNQDVRCVVCDKNVSKNIYDIHELRLCKTHLNIQP